MQAVSFVSLFVLNYGIIVLVVITLMACSVLWSYFNPLSFAFFAVKRESERDRQTDRQTDSRIDRGRETYRQADRGTDRQ